MMMKEYMIANKVKGLFLPHEDQMHTILIYTGTGDVLRISKEEGWSKNAVSLSITDASDPKIVSKAVFKSRSKLEMAIKMLESYKELLDE
jgi:hypothetical protein